MSSREPVLKVEHLHVWFDLAGGSELHAVQGVSFELRPGEMVGIMGASGAGTPHEEGDRDLMFGRTYVDPCFQRWLGRSAIGRGTGSGCAPGSGRTVL